MKFISKILGSNPKYSSAEFVGTLRLGVLVQGSQALEGVTTAKEVCATLVNEADRFLKPHLARYEKLSLPAIRVDMKVELVRILNLVNDRLHERIMRSEECRGQGYSVELILFLADFSIIAHVGTNKTDRYQIGNSEGHHDRPTKPETKYRLRKKTFQGVSILGTHRDDYEPANALGMYESVNVTFSEGHLTHKDRFLFSTLSVGALAKNEFVLQAAFGNRESSEQITGEEVWRNLMGFTDPQTDILALCVDVQWPEENKAEASVRKIIQLQKTLGAPKLFESLNDDERGILISIANIKSYKAGEQIMKEGQSGRDLYIVLQGTTSLEMGGKWIRDDGPGTLYGDISYILNSNRTATVTTKSPTHFIEFNAADFDRILKGNIELRVKILENMLHLSISRFVEREEDLLKQLE